MIDRISSIEKFNLADRLFNRAESELGQEFANLFGDIFKESFDELRFSGEALTQLWVLSGDTNGAGIQMADAHHDATGNN